MHIYKDRWRFYKSMSSSTLTEVPRVLDVFFPIIKRSAYRVKVTYARRWQRVEWCMQFSSARDKRLLIHRRRHSTVLMSAPTKTQRQLASSCKQKWLLPTDLFCHRKTHARIVNRQSAELRTDNQDRKKIFAPRLQQQPRGRIWFNQTQRYVNSMFTSCRSGDFTKRARALLELAFWLQYLNNLTCLLTYLE